MKPKSSELDSSAGVPPAVSGASRARFGEVKIRDRGRLPHWERENATYFVTFRLADSLPKAILDEITSEKESIIKTSRQLKRELSPDEKARIHELSTTRVEEYLDKGAGECFLARAETAAEMAGALRHFDTQRYRLFSWCIMPNHVHVFAAHTLSSILHTWKSFTAKRINSLLKRTGEFWQREYYDHLLRDSSEFEHTVRYVLDNPVKAGLHNWPWVWMSGRDAPSTAGEDAGATL